MKNIASSMLFVLVAGCGSTATLPPEPLNSPPTEEQVYQQCWRQARDVGSPIAPTPEYDAATCDEAYADENEAGFKVGTYTGP